MGSGNLGVAGTIENSQCRLDVGASSIVKTYNSVTVNLALTFKAGLPGPQNTYLYTGDSGNLAANWQQMGTWTTSTVSSVGPTLVSATPNTGAGLAQTFSYMASSPNGYSYIAQMYALFESTIGVQPACEMYYNPVTNYVVLIDDAGGWGMSQHLGTPGTLHNSQCTLDYGASSATGSGNNLTLNLALTFNSSWSGTKNNYSYVSDRGNHAAGWTQMGAWTIPVFTTVGHRI